MLQDPTNHTKAQQYVKYGSNLMKNPEVLKCHEDLITLDTYVQQGKTMDNKATRSPEISRQQVQKLTPQ